MIERLVDLHCKPGSPFDGDDRALAHALIAQHEATGTLAVERDATGGISGFMAWIRTDRHGADCVRWLGLSNLIFLAVPIAFCGPFVVITFDAIAPGADSLTIARLYAQVKAASPDGKRLATHLVTRRGAKWVERRLHS